MASQVLRTYPTSRRRRQQGYGFGPFLLPVRWFTLYWGSFSALLLLVSSGIWVRGKDTSLKQRFLRIDLPLAPRIGAGLALLSFIGSGVFIYYNTNVLHRYQSSKDAIRNQANYEKWFRADWYKKPQPKVVDVDIDVDVVLGVASDLISQRGGR